MSDVQSIMLTSSIKSNDIESFEWSKASKACIGTVKTDFADMHVYICDLIEPAMSNLSGRVISLSGQTYSGCPYRFYTCMNLAKWVVLQGCHMASCYRRDQVWDTEGWQGLCRSDVAWAGCEQARWKALAESLLNTKKTVIQSSTNSLCVAGLGLAHMRGHHFQAAAPLLQATSYTVPTLKATEDDKYISLRNMRNIPRHDANKFMNSWTHDGMRG